MSKETVHSKQDFSIELDVHTLNISIDNAVFVPESDSVLVLTDSRSVRISGVRSCDDTSRHNKAANECFTIFLKDMLYANRSLKYLDSKILSVKASWKNRTSIDGKRSCTGTVTATCQVRFLKE